MKLIETYEEMGGSEIEVFECERCKRQHSVHSGGDIACCPCEYEGEQ